MWRAWLDARGNAVPRSQARLLLATVLVLNGLDVLLTAYAVQRGLAIEGNPIVGAIGLPGKFVFVTLAAWLVYRLKPRALIIPAVALGAVVIYAATGIVLSAG